MPKGFHHLRSKSVEPKKHDDSSIRKQKSCGSPKTARKPLCVISLGIHLLILLRSARWTMARCHVKCHEQDHCRFAGGVCMSSLVTFNETLDKRHILDWVGYVRHGELLCKCA